MCPAAIQLVPDLDKSVHSHNCQVWLCFGIVDEVQVHQLLQLKIVGLHAVDYMRKQHGHILADRHRSNHFLDCIFLLALVQARKILFVLMYLT